ncbi:MAG TPA: serine protease [Phycisphaerales bacterium]|nr:serine protease [Phycisphaerales bacterium]
MRTPNHAVFAAAACFLLSASCSSYQSSRVQGNFLPSSGSSAGEAAAVLPVVPADTLERTVVRVEVPEGDTGGGRSYRAGTGVYVGHNTVVTAHHVIADGPAESSVVQTMRLVPWTAERSARNNLANGGGTLDGAPYLDLAIIETNKHGDVEAARLAVKRPAVGDEVTAFGLGGGGKHLRQQSGRVVGRSLDGTFLAMDFSSIKGDSGGPVFNSSGELIGIILGGGPDYTPWRVRVFPEREQQFSIIYPDFERARAIDGQTLVLDLTGTKVASMVSRHRAGDTALASR